MKKWTWLLVVLVAALLALPGWVGRMLEPQLLKHLQYLSDSERALGLQVHSIERGWFTTRVLFDLKPAGLSRFLGGTQSVAQVDTLQLVADVRHGPFGLLDGPFLGQFRALVEPGRNNPRVAEFVRLAGLKRLFALQVTGHFDGSRQLRLSVPPIAASSATLLDDTETGTIRFSGLTLDGDWQPAQALKLRGGFGSLLVEGALAQFRVAGATLQMDARALAEHLWLGPLALQFEALDLRSKGQPPSLALQSLALALKSTAQPGASTTDLTVSARASALSAPGVAVTDANLTASTAQLPIALLADYAASGNREQLLQALVAAAPTVLFNPIAFTADGQALAGKLQLATSADARRGADSVSWTDPVVWLAMLKADGAVQVAQPLAERMVAAVLGTQMRTELGDQGEIGFDQIDVMAALQAPLRLTSFVNQGWVRESGDGYAVALRYQAGTLHLNDQIVPLSALAQ
ncbi:MAG: DUF945 family protein [Pseudomonadales bacterium]